MRAALLAVDGGNSKTDVALADAGGHVLAAVRGPGSSPHHLGLDGCLTLLEGLLDEALAIAGMPPVGRPGRAPVARVGRILLAGADLPHEERELQLGVEARGWAEHAVVSNDAFAVLRNGTEIGWGVAVVCGAGINCIGVSPDGRQARFPALGPITGDWGGGYDIGMAALGAAVRGDDGRGPGTALQDAVPAYFGMASAYDVAEALHRRALSEWRLVELAPVVFGLTDHDEVAGELVDRLADEVATLARVALRRLDLTGRKVPVVLGGGLLQAGHPRLHERIVRLVEAVAPDADVVVETSPAIVGAALLALDELAHDAAAAALLRRELAERGAVTAGLLMPTPVSGDVRRSIHG